MTVTLEAIEAEAFQRLPWTEPAWSSGLISSLDIDPAFKMPGPPRSSGATLKLKSGEASLLPGPETLADLKAQFR